MTTHIFVDSQVISFLIFALFLIVIFGGILWLILSYGAGTLEEMDEETNELFH